MDSVAGGNEDVTKQLEENLLPVKSDTALLQAVDNLHRIDLDEDLHQ